jgi:deoxyribonuclease IV
MPSLEPRIGAHIAVGDGLLRAADRAAEIGLEAVQVFADNPTAWRRRAEPAPELPEFQSRLTAAEIRPVVIHASYLVNPAGADPVNRDRSVEVLASELAAADGFGATIVNVHIGSHGGAGRAAGIASLVDVLRRARAIAADEAGSRGRAVDPPTITLENSAGGGFGLGTDLDELAAIATALDSAGFDATAIGFCLDTAHAWGAGIDIADPDAIDAFLAAFDGSIGLGRLHLVHLNDSSSERGSRADRHQHVGAGRIGAAGLGHLLRHPSLAGRPFVLETPGMDEGYDAINAERARMLFRGEPLPELPAEAFQLRGSRARAATRGSTEPHSRRPPAPVPSSAD